MKFLTSGRKSGKTTQLMFDANEAVKAEEEVCIVVVNLDLKRHWIKKAREMGYKLPEPITHDQFRNGDRLAGSRAIIYIDDIDYLLSRLAGPLHIRMVTATSEEFDA